MSKGESLSSIKTKDALESYLCQKALKHNCFKIYGSSEKIERIILNHELILTDGDHWNDNIDKKDFNSPNSLSKNFGVCFSFSKSESVAMWMLYGGYAKTGLMLNFKPSHITSITQLETLDFGRIDKDKSEFIQEMQLDNADFNIRLIDVLYYSSDDGKYTFKRSDDRVDEQLCPFFDSIQG